MMEDVEKIARGLTKAQREAVRTADILYGVFGTQPFRNRLAALNLCIWEWQAGRYFSPLSALGLAVRQHLQEQGE